MSHQIVPTTWNPEICSDCGFPASQHAVLYGAPDHMNRTHEGEER